MHENNRTLLVCCLLIVSLVAGGVGGVAFSLPRQQSTCPGECCPCDAVDAHVVAKWLDANRADVMTNTGQGVRQVYSNSNETKGCLLVICLEEEADADTGQAPEGDE